MNNEDEQMLLAQNKSILSGEAYGEVYKSIKGLHQLKTDRIFILDWIPDQGEDFYYVVTDGDTVHKVEMEKKQKKMLAHEKWSISEFKKTRIGKPLRRKLALIERLSKAS